MNMLRSIREKKGLTLSQLAARSSISSRVLIEYEEGRQPISLPHAKLLAKALWVQIEDLMPPAGTVPPPTPATAPAPVTYSPPPAPRPAPQPSYAAPAPAPAPAQRPAYDTQNNRHAEAPARQDGPRGPRPGGDSRGGRTTSVPAGRGEARATRPPRPLPPPPGPIGEGQLEELMRLASRLDISREQLEERVGKNLNSLTRPEAKDWIKKIRAIADEIAPTHKVQYGQWPEAQEDREAAYLDEQRNAGATFLFKLFNGEQFRGVITDFTPYTITVKPDDQEGEVVLRKLAIAYYKKQQGAQANGQNGATEATEPQATAKPRAKASRAVAGQSSSASNLDSDRVGEPQSPETDNMDEDRGV